MEEMQDGRMSTHHHVAPLLGGDQMVNLQHLMSSPSPHPLPASSFFGSLYGLLDSWGSFNNSTLLHQFFSANLFPSAATLATGYPGLSYQQFPIPIFPLGPPQTYNYFPNPFSTTATLPTNGFLLPNPQFNNMHSSWVNNQPTEPTQVNNNNAVHTNSPQQSNSSQQQQPQQRPKRQFPKIYSCPTCNRSFAYKQGLQNHIRTTHTGDKPHLCGRGFSGDHHLKAHLGLHRGGEGPPPHSSTHSHNTVAQLGNLRHHLKSVHPPHSCQLCGSTFSNSFQLRTHLLIHYGPESEDMEHQDNPNPNPSSASVSSSSSNTTMDSSSSRKKRERKSRETRRVGRVSGGGQPPVSSFTAPEQTHPQDLRVGGDNVEDRESGSGFGLGSGNFRSSGSQGASFSSTVASSTVTCDEEINSSCP